LASKGSGDAVLPAYARRDTTPNAYLADFMQHFAYAAIGPSHFRVIVAQAMPVAQNAAHPSPPPAPKPMNCAGDEWRYHQVIIEALVRHAREDADLPN
jgi:hypothetical protein